VVVLPAIAVVEMIVCVTVVKGPGRVTISPGSVIVVVLPAFVIVESEVWVIVWNALLVRVEKAVDV
jgi:hypothetical protein